MPKAGFQTKEPTLPREDGTKRQSPSSCTKREQRRGWSSPAVVSRGRAAPRSRARIHMTSPKLAKCRKTKSGYALDVVWGFSAPMTEAGAEVVVLGRNAAGRHIVS